MGSPVKKLGTARLLFNSAGQMGLQPSWIITGGIFVINTPSGEKFINRGVSSLNSPLSTSLVRNKFHTRLILERHGLPNIPYMRTRLFEEAEAFLDRHSTIIVKPIKGEGSRDIYIVNTKEQLAELNLKSTILEKYAPGIEMRYLVLEGEVIAVHESKYGSSVDQHRELERISYDKEEWDAELVAMSRTICSIFGLGFAAIDFMLDDRGIYILEINSSPGFKWFHAPSVGPGVDVASLFLQATIDQFERKTELAKPMA